MLARLLRRFTARPARSVAASPALAESASASLPNAPSSPASGAPASSAASRELPRMEVLLRAEVHRRAQELIEGFTTAERKGDGAALLDKVARDPILTIRQLPIAAQKALALCAQPEVDAARLVALFERDPTLATSLLRHANSVFYATGAACTTLRDAVNRVGVSGVQSVLLASTVEGLLCRPGGEYGHMVELTWQHMVRTGPIARDIATAFGANAEEAFLLGLMHDVGKLVLFDEMATCRQEWRRVADVGPELVRHILGRLHEPLGGLAMVRWGLGNEAAHAVATHHREPLPTVPNAMSEVLFVAERLDLALLRGTEPALEAWWTAGALTGNRELIASRLARLTSDHAPKQRVRRG